MSLAAAHVPSFARLMDLEARVAEIEASPASGGRLELIVARPAANERTVLERGTLDLEVGLVGDNWHARKNPDPEAQLTLMSSRVVGLLAPREHWPLAGDQLFVDLDLGRQNLPPGTRLAIGSAVIEVSAEPHTGCRKFKERFGADALRFISTKRALEMQLRGVNARVVQPGEVAVGDRIVRL